MRLAPLGLRMIRFAWITTLPLLSSGCFGPFFEHIKIDPTTVGKLRLQVPAYTEEDLKGRDYSVLQPLSATSCKNKFWDPSPTTEDATDQLRVKAARLGGNGVQNVTCEASRGTSLTTNCW
jgi:hypothetical protein